MREKLYFEHKANASAFSDFSSYKLNRNQNSRIYEEQQMAAAALNSSRRQSDRSPWFVKK